MDSVTPVVTETPVVAAAPVVDPKVVTPAEDKSVLDAAVDPAKVAQEAENKRILEADEKTLNDADKSKRAELVKAKEAADVKAKAGLVPEKYELKMVDGIAAQGELLDKVTPVFKELKITSEGAQKLADVYGPYLKEAGIKAGEAFKKQQEDNFQAFIKSERENTYTKLGAEKDATLALVAKTRDRFFPPEVRELMFASGLADNYEFNMALAKIGKQISEDQSIEGPGEKPGSTKSQAEIMYGKDKT
jgi:hypothetical protein